MKVLLCQIVVVIIYTYIYSWKAAQDPFPAYLPFIVAHFQSKIILMGHMI